MIHGVRLLYCAGGGWCTIVLGAAGVSQDFTPPSQTLLGQQASRPSYLDQDGNRIVLLSLLEITSPLLGPVTTNNKPTWILAQHTALT